MTNNSKKTTEKKLKQPLKMKLFPLILSVVAILADQISKALVVKNIPLYSIYDPEEGAVIPVLGNFLRFIHVRNNAVAFSLGHSLPQDIRTILFSFAPLVVIILVYVIYFRNNEFTKLQRWSICGILGGGLGNLIDRFFRPAGVVDFIDCAFWGDFFKRLGYTGNSILSWTRWPTYNIADSFVVVCGALFIISFIILLVKDSKKNKSEEK